MFKNKLSFNAKHTLHTWFFIPGLELCLVKVNPTKLYDKYFFSKANEHISSLLSLIHLLISLNYKLLYFLIFYEKTLKNYLYRVSKVTNVFISL